MNFWTARTLRISLWIVLAAVFFFAVEYFRYSQDRPLASVQRWFILLSYNASKNPVSTGQLAHWDMAVLDADVHPPLTSFEKNTRKIGYVSLGEAEQYRDYWPKVRDAPWRLEENPNWKGNYFVDVRESLAGGREISLASYNKFRALRGDGCNL